MSGPGKKDEPERKERVIHTRVPESLDEEIRSRAERLGMSVSNLVRNALNHTFGLVEDVIVDGTNVARSVGGDELVRGRAPAAQAGQPAAAPAPAAPPRIIGWQPLILNLNAVCATCNAILPKGKQAATSVTDHPAPPTIICMKCVEELGDGSDEQPGDASAAGGRAADTDD